MIWLFALLCCIIIAVASAKMSLMPWKVSLPWIILWGVAGFFAAFLFAGMSQKQVFSLLNPANISTLEFIELMIMLCFIFSDGIVKRILGYYPGLMMVASVAMISLLLIRLFPGMDFSWQD